MRTFLLISFSLGLGELLPDMDSLLPHFRGNLQVGPKINIRWNLGELLGLGVEWWKGYSNKWESRQNL